MVFKYVLSRSLSTLSREARRAQRAARPKDPNSSQATSSQHRVHRQSTLATVAKSITASSVLATGVYWAVLNDNQRASFSTFISNLAPIQYLTVQLKTIAKPFTDPSRDELLPNFHDIPGMPENARQPPTLVIALEDTLIHSEWDRKHGWRHAKRPGVDKFIETMARYYEIVLFSKQLATVGEEIVVKLDPKHIIMHYLFRDATHFYNGVHVKDISKLNRDPNRVIILDADPDGYLLQPENGIPIAPYTDGTDRSDTALLDMIPFLQAIVTENVRNVPQTLDTFRDSNGLLEDLPSKYAAHKQAQQQQRMEVKSRGLGGLIRNRKI